MYAVILFIIMRVTMNKSYYHNLKGYKYTKKLIDSYQISPLPSQSPLCHPLSLSLTCDHQGRHLTDRYKKPLNLFNKIEAF